MCRKRKAHAEREAKAQAKRDKKKRELAAKLAKSPVKTVRFSFFLFGRLVFVSLRKPVLVPCSLFPVP